VAISPRLVGVSENGFLPEISSLLYTQGGAESDPFQLYGLSTTIHRVSDTHSVPYARFSPIVATPSTSRTFASICAASIPATRYISVWLA